MFSRAKWQTLSGVFLLIVTLSVPSAYAAVSTMTKGAPPWLSLFGVAFNSKGDIFIVGSKAHLLVSKDHGKTWTSTRLHERPGSILFQDRDLYSIRFAPDGKTGWITGEDGIVFHTTDGGATWHRQKTGVTNNLFKVAAIDDQNAFVVGSDGIMIRTTDGGSTWQKLKSPKDMTWFDVEFTSSTTGWIVGEFETILESTDGGATWQIVHGGNMGNYTIGPLFSITFSDPQDGVASGLSGELLVTSDGGKTWQPKTLPRDSASYTLAQDPSGKMMWAGAAGGRMFDMNQAGMWQEAARKSFHDITDIAFAGNYGVAVGLDGTILLTENAGEKWQAVQ